MDSSARRRTRTSSFPDRTASRLSSTWWRRSSGISSSSPKKIYLPSPFAAAARTSELVSSVSIFIKTGARRGSSDSHQHADSDGSHPRVGILEGQFCEVIKRNERIRFSKFFQVFQQGEPPASAYLRPDGAYCFQVFAFQIGKMVHVGRRKYILLIQQRRQNLLNRLRFSFGVDSSCVHASIYGITTGLKISWVVT